jgi:hypothetical protein
MSPLTPHLSISEGKEQRGGINTSPEASLSRPPPPQPYGTSDDIQAKITELESGLNYWKNLADKMAGILDEASRQHCPEDAYDLAIEALDLHTESHMASIDAFTLP